MNRSRMFLLLVGLVVALAALVAYAAPVNQMQTLRVEVAENGAWFAPDPTHVFDDGFPAYGNVFITQGYIYPEGTLNESNGVLANGDPEFPDRVIGRWVCRGWFIGDGFHTESGPVVLTTQMYDLGEAAGSMAVFTEGYELIDVGMVVQRAIVGGTGDYSGAEGVQRQELLGFNATQGGNIRVEFQLMGSAAS